MRGVRSEDHSAIMNFLYHSEANILKDNMDSFLTFAEERQLKGFVTQHFDHFLRGQGRVGPHGKCPNLKQIFSEN